MKTRLDEIIEKLDNCLEDDIKISSQIFGLAAASLQKNQQLLERLKEKYEASSNSKLLLSELPEISLSFLKNRYGSYHKAYQAYQDCYGIKCQRGWKNLLEKIQNLEPPRTLEERVTDLEETIAILVELVISSVARE